jgi:hypothetical protein
MKNKKLLIALILVSAGLVIPKQAQAAGTYSHQDQPICSFTEHKILVDDCFIPDFWRTFQKKQITKQPLPIRIPDPALSNIPFYYARVTRENAPLFMSLEAAIAGKPVYRTLETGFDFVTYIDLERVDGKRYFMIAPGIWMAGDGVSPISTPTFQSLELITTPRNDFGWVLFNAEGKGTPGYGQFDYTGQYFNRYDVVQIFNVRQVSGIEWYQIGLDEWVEGPKVARVTPNIKPPDGLTSNRWIEVNLQEQTLSVYDQGHLVFASLVSTGLPGAWTQPGLFQIYLKKEAETMSGAFTADRSDYYYLEDVPWTMYFDQARALHGTYWHNGYGVPRSRGCVNLSPGDAQWIYNWAKDGDWIYIWDPSGQTPTDPNLYGAGGA